MLKLVSESNQSHEKDKDSDGMMKKLTTLIGFKGIISVVFLLTFVVFCFQNVESTSIQFLAWKFLEVPKLYLISLLTALGFSLGVIFGVRYKQFQRFKRNYSVHVSCLSGCLLVGKLNKNQEPHNEISLTHYTLLFNFSLC